MTSSNKEVLNTHNRIIQNSHTAENGDSSHAIDIRTTETDNGNLNSGSENQELSSSYRCDDIFTNLASALVSGSHMDLTGSREAFSSCRDVRKNSYSDRKHDYFRSASSVGRVAGSNNNVAQFSKVKDVNETEKGPLDAQDRTSRVNLAPDGGWGWVIVFCSACISAIISASYTGFSMYYPEIGAAFHANKAVTGWIGSLHLATGNFLGIFFSLPVRKYGSRPVCIIGAFITVAGYIISSFGNSLAYLYISYGLIAGLGTGMSILAVLVIVQQYFNKKRAIAAGLSACGFSVGSLCVGPIVGFLIDRYTWRGAMLIHSAAFLQIIPLALLYRPLVSPGQKTSRTPQSLGEEPITNPSGRLSSCCQSFVFQIRAAFDFSLLKDVGLFLYIFSQVFIQISFQTFYQHTPSRAIHYGVDRSLIALLPLVSSVGTGISRFIFSFVANAPCTHRLIQYSVTNALAAITQAMMFVATDFLSLVILCTIEGVFFGGGLCILTTLLVDLSGIENIARAQSLMSVSLGIGMLISVPFSGFLFDVTQNYNVPFVVTGLLHLIGACCAAGTAILRR